MILISSGSGSGEGKDSKMSKREGERDLTCVYIERIDIPYVSAKTRLTFYVTMAAFSRALHNYFILIDLLIKFKCNSQSSNA